MKKGKRLNEIYKLDLDKKISIWRFYSHYCRGSNSFYCKGNLKEIVQRVAQSLGISERDLWYCIQFRKKYPDLNNLPEGKNITWHKIENRLLKAEKL